MTFYGAKELADSFRTVRKNTIQIAEDIPEDKYSFTPANDCRTVAQELAHIAVAPVWQHHAHGVDNKDSLTFEDFGKYMGRGAELENQLTTKAQIIAALHKNGDDFATFLESLTPERLGQRVNLPVQPSSKTRFEMLMGVKEHEMHHRAKLMVVQRLLGIVPHLTRARQQQMQGQATAPARA
jgi:uncharacterized damage-inducible protein DinB